MTLKEMVAKKEELMNLKKSAIKYTDTNFTVNKGISKAMHDDDDDDRMNKNIVGNTYNFMDSHNDVHIKGIFSKSISERSDKIFHLHDHKYEIEAKVGMPKGFSEMTVAWRDLGLNKDGDTTALVMNSDIIKDYNEKIFKAYKKGEITQHSVGMRYIKLELAVNDAEEKEEFAVWNNYIELIANKDEAIDKGFFWAIKEAALIEISAVLMGSNPLTGVLENKIEPINITPTLAEKSLDNQKEFYKHLI